ncbi:hypothetical protein U5801_07825 [Lamprobacter modestohalophilus]|uniref:alpha/beta hydrolase n=1 Tax=Lamprobacter modestohalophilus TaxID=1064514 RepID=UPI002ADECF23|nr:hypothetical protein [Lamprobacter modestohalophilus]MEA1049714.1 hypothetical protein [Lamprobacter modestohalophilus]
MTAVKAAIPAAAAVPLTTSIAAIAFALLAAFVLALGTPGTAGAVDVDKTPSSAQIAAGKPSHQRLRPPADALTPSSGVMALDHVKHYYAIPEFRLGGTYDLDADPASWRNGGEGGTTLESLGSEPLRVAYIAVGTPKRNDAGEIINAVVINTFYSGDATNMYNFWYEGQAGNAFSGGAIVGPGRVIDTDRYYVVFLDALGLWGASKPSDGLGRQFPAYSYFDMVQANYRLLREHLKIAQVEVVTGVSMGATQAWVWGVMHSPSGYVKAILPIGGTTASDSDDPVGAWTFLLAQAALESDPVWRKTKGHYYHLPIEEHPRQGLQFMWSRLQLTGFSFPLRSAAPWAEIEREVFHWQPEGNQTAAFIARTKNEDAVDFWYRNDAGFRYNINDELGRIQARTLVVHVETDKWLLVDNARQAADAVDGAVFASFPDPTAHYGVFRAPNVLAETIGAFVDDRFTTNLPGIAGAANASQQASAEERPAGLAK